MFLNINKKLISVILICSFTVCNIIPVFAEDRVIEDNVRVNATVLPRGVFIPPAAPEIGPGGDYPDFPNPEEAKEKSEIPISIMINSDNQFTNSKNVTLTFSAKRAAQVAISNSPDFESVSWEDFNADLEANLPNEGFVRVEKPWILIDGVPTAPYGVIRTVYAKFRSKEGGVSGIVSDSIILDTVAPSNVSDFKVEGNTHPHPSQEGNIQEGNITSVSTTPDPSSSEAGSTENPLLRGVAEGRGVFLTWNNPSEADFSKVKIFRSEKFYPDEPIEGGEWESVLIYEGNGNSYTDFSTTPTPSSSEAGSDEDCWFHSGDSPVEPECEMSANRLHSPEYSGTMEPAERYYYTIFAYDFAGNNSSGAVGSVAVGAVGVGEGECEDTKYCVPTEMPVYPPSLPSPKIVHILELADISFFIDGVEIFLDKEKLVKIPAGKQAKISISAEKLPKTLKTIFVTIGGEGSEENFYLTTYLLKINNQKTAYEADITTPEINGIYFFNLAVMNFKDGTLEKLSARFVIDGGVYIKSAVNFKSGMENAYEYSEKNGGILAVFVAFSLLVLMLVGSMARKVYGIVGRTLKH